MHSIVLNSLVHQQYEQYEALQCPWSIKIKHNLYIKSRYNYI